MVFDNFVSHLKTEKERALEWCCEEMKPLVKDYYEKCRNTYTESVPRLIHITNIFIAIKYLAYNTAKDNGINKEELVCIKGIIGELDLLYRDITESIIPINDDYYTKKIDIISNILKENMIDFKYKTDHSKEDFYHGKVFKNYRDLYLLINLININYDDLCKRGLNINIFHDFKETLTHQNNIFGQQTEDDKLELFLMLMYGTAKFSPVYERKAIGYCIVPANRTSVTLINTDTPYDKEISLELAVPTSLKFDLDTIKKLKKQEVQQ